MSMKNRTKQMFADMLEDMLHTKDFEKIQVKDICEACGTRRQTFYYHFKDKYDLVAWIFNQDYEAVFSVDDNEFTIDTLTKLLELIRSKSSFYKKTLTDHSQNSIRSYIQEFDVEFGQKVVMSAYQTDQISDEQLYIIKYHSYGSIGMLIEWLLNDTILSAEQLAMLQYQTMPLFLRNAYIQYHST